MKTMTTEKILSKYPEEIIELALSARKLLLNELPDCMEIPDEKANMIAFGYANTYTDLICTVILSKKGIKIGFNKGSELNDPEALLEGSGKVHKYVQINEKKELKNPALKQLIKQGLKAWKLRAKK